MIATMVPSARQASCRPAIVGWSRTRRQSPSARTTALEPGGKGSAANAGEGCASDAPKNMADAISSRANGRTRATDEHQALPPRLAAVYRACDFIASKNRDDQECPDIASLSDAFG